MDSFSFQDLKTEKAKAIRRYHSLQKITTLFRLIGLCLILILIARFFTTYLAVHFKSSGEAFRWPSVNLVSSRIIFIVGNVIIVVLFLKSGRLGNKQDGSVVNLCDEYVENSFVKNHNIYRHESRKQKLAEEIKGDKYDYGQRKISWNDSEILKRVKDKGSCREARRSVAENRGGNVNYSVKTARISYAEDEMSSEEFRQTVEAFIARQQRFLREEEL